MYPEYVDTRVIGVYTLTSSIQGPAANVDVMHMSAACSDEQIVWHNLVGIWVRETHRTHSCITM